MSEEIVDGFAWTPELRARVYPSRKISNPPFIDATLEGVSLTHPIDAKAARDSAAYYWKENKREAARVKTGLANNPPAWRGAVEAALARHETPKVEHPLEVDVEAATVTLEMCPLFAALPYWLSRGGIPFALRALIRCHELASHAKVNGYNDKVGTWILETRAYSIDFPEGNADAWMMLRAMLANAIEPIYDEAHGIADQARLKYAGGKPDESALALLLPFAFPDEKAWAKAGAASAIELAKQRKRGYTQGLASYLSVAPVETAIELLACTVNDAVGADDVLAIFAHQGTATGLRVLETAILNAPNNDDRKQLLELGLAARTPAAFAMFDRLAKNKTHKGAKAFAAFAQRYWTIVTPPKPAKAKPKAKPRRR